MFRPDQLDGKISENFFKALMYTKPCALFDCDMMVHKLVPR